MAAEDKNVGAVFGGRWRIERPLSSGGMGSVYVAVHGDTGRKVALKLIKGVPSPELVARFRRETGALAAVSHPNVVTFLDSGFEGEAGGEGTFFLVMELLEGRPLRSVMKAPVEWRRAFRVMADVCRALSAVHKAGIVHRDLKPENIFLQSAEGHDEIAKLIDFGIVRLEDRSTMATMTSTGAVVGTPGYISPEQLKGEAASVASDVYAVGVILYELVTGKFPFEAPTPHAMLVRQLIDPLTPPRTALATVPAHVENVILRFMDKDPAQRTSTAKDALAVLVDALKLDDSLPADAPTETGPKLAVMARDIVAQATPPLPTRVVEVPLAKATAPTGIVVDPLGVATRKQRSFAERVSLVAGILCLSWLGTCGLCVGMGKCGDGSREARGGNGGNGGDDAQAAADALSNFANDTPPTPPPTPQETAREARRLRHGLKKDAASGAHINVNGNTVPLANVGAILKGAAKAAGAQAIVVAIANDNADELLDCSHRSAPVRLRITALPSGDLRLDTPPNPAIAGLECARQRIATWGDDGLEKAIHELNGDKPVTVDVDLPLGE